MVFPLRLRGQDHVLPRGGGMLVAALALGVGVAGAGPVRAEESAADLAAGEAAYRQSCARCHGVEGRGDGVDAKRFYPRPRDLTLGIYKFRSTVSGTPPTDEDLFRAVTHGLPGTNMPDWAHLDEAVRWELVAYLKSLSTSFEQLEPEPIRLTEDPGPAAADPAVGRAVYEKLGCAACHGTLGRGDGPSAATLVDDWGMAIRPANLTQGWSYRGGADPRAIAVRMLAGIDGSGMPSYQEAASPEEVWQLAYYVASLQEPEHWNLVARAAVVSGPLPETPQDSRWALTSPTDVRLRNAVDATGTWAAPPTVTAVSFRLLANEEAVAFRVQWDDPARDAEPPGDGVALVWKPADVRGDVVTLQAWPYRGAPALDLAYWSAATGGAHEFITAELEHLARPAGASVTLPSRAAYQDGRWALVLQRPRRLALEGAAVLSSERRASMAFVVWDGSQPDQRAVSPWTDMELGAQRADGRDSPGHP